ncbi:phosphate ABC transporter permease subunit PstC [Glycomyces xiaoerkulensis]|uniref:phosphate ABC transporter permease subunit PstC n=1 Tax=Glycomyces xiaoerkulensis TaxID=2038139 RepID=UPI000C25B7EA|nr:phosphate ABC transporter permease subunit PstC [Glycomyces xiaoerkulensis]
MTTSPDLAAPPDSGGLPNLRPSSPRYGEKIIFGILAGSAVISVATTVAIVLSLIMPSLDFFRDVSIVEFLTGTEWSAGFQDAQYGVLALLSGTIQVVFYSLLVSIPVGLGVAIYLNEYAPDWVRRAVTPVLEILAGVPTVAIGLWALYALTPIVADLLPFLEWGTYSIGVAGLAVGLMSVPIVSSVSQDALRAVPDSLRQGAFALGSTKREVSIKIAVPAAFSGIVASIILAASRAVGETMIVLMAGGGRPQFTFDPTEPVLAMTSFIGQTATGDIAAGTTTYDTIFAVGLLLFTITLILNMLAIRMVRRFREVYE